MQRFATITVIGRDKTGVVARITNFLFLQKANIEALEEQVTRGQFSMTIQASWKDRDLDRDTIGGGLARLASELEMEIKARFTEPRPGARIFIVTRQQKDGCQASQHETTEIVLPKPSSGIGCRHPIPPPSGIYVHRMYNGCSPD